MGQREALGQLSESLLALGLRRHIDSAQVGRDRDLRYGKGGGCIYVGVEPTIIKGPIWTRIWTEWAFSRSLAGPADACMVFERSSSPDALQSLADGAVEM